MTHSRWSMDAVGSTRAVGLLRIALALIIWARYAREMGLFNGVEWWSLALSIAFFAATSAMLLGLYARAATAAVGAILIYFYYGLGIGGVWPLFFGHHAYLLMATTCLLALTPCGRSYSFDRFRAMNRREELPEEAPLWGQNLIVLQMASLYFWTAFDKSGTPFLSGDRLEAIFNWGHTNRPIEPFLAVPGFAMAASVAVVAVEYFLAVGILVRRLAKFAIPAGLLLHAGF